MFTGISSELTAISRECHRNFARISNWSKSKTGDNHNSAFPHAGASTIIIKLLLLLLLLIIIIIVKLIMIIISNNNISPRPAAARSRSRACSIYIYIYIYVERDLYACIHVYIYIYILYTYAVQLRKFDCITLWTYIWPHYSIATSQNLLRYSRLLWCVYFAKPLTGWPTTTLDVRCAGWPTATLTSATWLRIVCITISRSYREPNNGELKR